MKAVLDACVLYPTILREILADVAGAGLFTPVWSQRILDEWRIAADRAGLSAGVEIALLEARFEAAKVEPASEGDRLDLPDPADLHVVQAALAADAPLIVTANLRDFPGHVLAGLGMRAMHPDEFLRDCFLVSPEAVLAAIEAAANRARAAGGDFNRKQLMKRARLPRLAKAVERLASTDVPVKP